MPKRAPLFLLALAACGEATGGAPAFVTRDSAGIRIAESAAPSWGEGEGWRLSEAPILEIGQAEGANPAYLLDRVTGALRLADGRIVIANGGSSELRFYDASGAHLHSAGAQGEGPGEYRNLAWLHRFRGDSLMVYDGWVQRVTVVDSNGAAGRTLTVPAVGSGARPMPTAPFANGTLLGRFTRVIREPVMGLVPSVAAYGAFDGVDGAVIDSLVSLPGADMFLEAVQGGFSVWAPLLGTSTHVAAHDDEAYFGFSGVHEVVVYGADGVLRRVIRRGLGLQPMSAEEYATLVEDRLDAIGAPGGRGAEQRERVAQAYAKLPVPTHRPAFAALLVDHGGNLWMRETTLPGEARMWSVFDADGLWLGPVEFPPEFTPFDIGEDFVLGVLTDDLGVQRVRIYGIERRQG